VKTGDGLVGAARDEGDSLAVTSRIFLLSVINFVGPGSSGRGRGRVRLQAPKNRRNHRTAGVTTWVYDAKMRQTDRRTDRTPLFFQLVDILFPRHTSTLGALTFPEGIAASMQTGIYRYQK